MNEKDIALKRSLSETNVWALALGCIVGWGAFVMPGNTFLCNAGPLGTAIAMLLSAIVLTIIAVNYNYMINLFPVSGGEFTYSDRAFGKKHAFLCSWFLGLSYLAIVPLNATALALIGRNLLDNIFQIGWHYTVAGYDVYLGEVLLAQFSILFLGWMSITGAKNAGIFQTFLAVALVAGVLIVSIVALFSSKTSYQNLYPLFYPSDNIWNGVLAVMAVAPWAFVGFDTVPQAAEEFSFSTKKTLVIMVISIFFGAFVYVALNTITISVLPIGYTSWVQYIDDIKNLSGLISLPTFFAAKTLIGSTGLLFLGVSVLAAILSGITGFYMATSRLFYSMARENVLPEWFGKLHCKYQTPINSIIFIMLLSVIAPFFGRTALGWIVDMSSVGAAIGYGYTSAAALKFAVEKDNWKIICTGIIGLFFSFLFLGLLLIPIYGFNCSLGKESYFCLGLWTILGILFYMNRK